MPSTEKLLESMRSEPWLYWSPKVRENISRVLMREAQALQKEITRDLLWHEFPILRGDAEDTLRAINDLRQLVSLTSVDDISVGMGEESAP